MTTYTLDPTQALLFWAEPGGANYRWNFRDAVGTPLNNPGGFGNGVQLSYSFLTSAAPGGPSAGFRAFNSTEQAAARLVLQSIAEMINVTWTEQASNGDVRIGMVSMDSGTAGYAYTPSFSYSYTTSGQTSTITSVTAQASAGDTYLSSSKAWTSADFTPSGSGWGTLVHEFGHALGLEHPFEGSIQLATDHDNTAYTVMSYTPHPHGLVRDVTITANGYSASYAYIEPETLMLYDIAALQQLYGANTSTRTGNDVYTFDPNRPFVKTIWDAAGNDTISASNFQLGVVINLAPGSFSSLRITPDPLPDWAQPDPHTDLYDGTDNLAIAFNCLIENAEGGQGNDQLLGNTGNNLLQGNAGDDSLNGGAGADTLVGGTGDDTYVVDNIGDVVAESASEGTDTVQSSVTWTLGTELENLTLTGIAAINGTGNTANNTLIGNEADNSLQGGAGNDTLNGEAGADTLVGGDGSDTYYVDNTGDVVTETNANAKVGGSDWVITSLSAYTLGANVEAGRILSAGSANLTGNALNNWLYAGAGDNVLDGGAGSDTASYNFAATGVTVSLAITGAQSTGGSGSDTLINFENLYGSKYNDTLTGKAAGNALYGDSGNDTLNGGAGADTLVGGTGNDTFVLASVTDTGITKGTWDVITDFVSGTDKIDLSAIDASTLTAGDQAFGSLTVGGTFSGAFAATASLYYDNVARVLYGNNDADAQADFAIALTGVTTLLVTDLIA